MLRLATLLALLVATPAVAQEPEPVRPGFKLHRFDEDWRALCDAARRERTLDPLKCLKLGGDTTLTLGGDLRERVEAERNPGFGLEERRDHAFLHRAMAHADLRVGEGLRTFVQIGAFGYDGRPAGREPNDLDRLDVVQAFADLSAEVGTGRATLRGGRQEMSFGSSRLVAVREGPNVRRAFDGARAFWSDGRSRVDAFYVRPVEIRPGTFDDRTSRSETFWGVYATTPVAGPLKADLYYLGRDRDRARFVAGAGPERRHTLGARLFGEASGFDWDWEGAVQVGDFAGGRIRAWTIATDSGYTFASVPLRPRIGLKADIASGDRRPDDGTLDTFDPLYPKFPYFSEANIVSPANIMDLHPSLGLQLTPRLSTQIGVNWLWRHRMADAIYEPPLNPVQGLAGRGSRYIGVQAIAGFEWEATEQVTVAGQYVHFRPGATLRGIGGKHVDFGVVSISYRF